MKICKKYHKKKKDFSQKMGNLIIPLIIMIINDKRAVLI